ncbi:MAG TPA: response regulator [Nitrospira sp.]|nr:response regulator [Nitrospira sp.]
MTTLGSTDSPTLPPDTGKTHGGLAQLLARRELELAAAQRMSEMFSQQIKLEDLMEHALRIALDVVDAENGSVLLVDRETNTLVFYHSIGEKPVSLGTSMPWYEGIAGAVYRSGQPEILPDAQLDRRHYKKVDEATGYTTRDMITIPLKQWQGVPIGVLQVMNKRGNRFLNQDDLAILTIISALAAVAIEHTWRVKEAEQELRESRDLLQKMNTTLEEQVQDRTRQLLANQEQLRSLAIELSRAEERARQKLAIDLHDNLAQMLALARMKLQNAEPALRASKTYQEVNGLLGESLAYTRAIMSDLRPPLLSDAHDLHRAISWVVDRVHRRGLSVIVETDPEPILLDEEVLTVTYQAIHELLFNVLKHAQTNQARLTLQRRDQALHAVVRDYGRGFDIRDRSTVFPEGGFGLLNLRERIELLGGRLEISSQPGQGTCAEIIMPLRGNTTWAHASDKLHALKTTGTLHERPREAADLMIRIVLVDDHAMVRDGLRSILEAHPDLCVEAEASDGQMAVELARQLRPDVIVMDVNMPGMNGLEATRRITTEFPEITVVGLSVQDDPATAISMQKAGAIGLVSKGDAAGNLVQMIRNARE